MTFDEYQYKAINSAVYPLIKRNMVYPAMGLSGEAGELCDKIKKHWRNAHNNDNEINNDFVMSAASLTAIEEEAIMLEMGDVLWYLAALANELCTSLDNIADMNLIKIEDRKKRGVLKSEGDNR